MKDILLKIKKPAPGNEEMLRYLEANNWILVQTWESKFGRFNASVRYYRRESVESEIAIPDEEFVEYASTISQVINEIAELEKKTSYEVYEEILKFQEIPSINKIEEKQE